MAAAIDIRPPAGDQDIALLEQYLREGTPEKHSDRYARQQQGRATYLVAWLAERPVGHLLIKWDGPRHEPMQSALPGCPELEDFYVAPAYRGRRIGVRLIEAAEALAAGRGAGHLGLAVGLTPDYDRARTIYLRRGYRSAGFAPYYEGWWALDATGTRVWWEEAVEYLVKPLQLGEGSDD
ncbi:MAG TPA: GNAT family N-acetyltransferase [Chloroflexota bacterium]|jgi:GNAT superfamily N-acetyltransferase|nr:GNAT family N-acetyltransferase [Chloroflexota bacterium]